MFDARCGPGVLGYAHAGAAETDAFVFEAKALFEAVLAGQGDAPAGGNDAVPRETLRAVQGPSGLAGGSGETGGFRNLAVGGDAAFGDARDDGPHAGEHGIAE